MPGARKVAGARASDRGDDGDDDQATRATPPASERERSGSGQVTGTVESNPFGTDRQIIFERPRCARHVERPARSGTLSAALDHNPTAHAVGPIGTASWLGWVKWFKPKEQY